MRGSNRRRLVLGLRSRSSVMTLVSRVVILKVVVVGVVEVRVVDTRVVVVRVSIVRVVAVGVVVRVVVTWLVVVSLWLVLGESRSDSELRNKFMLLLSLSKVYVVIVYRLEEWNWTRSLA